VAVPDLVARIETRLAATPGAGAPREVGDVWVDPATGRARRGGRALSLTATELRLLSHLAERPRAVCAKADLLREVWGYGGYDGNLVEVHVSALRRKLEAGGEPRVLHTVPRAGYCLRPAPAALMRCAA
jgi:DNA-binding response OmpR family regulator